MTQPKNSTPYKEPDLGFGWLKRPELGPIWVLMFAFLLIVVSPLIAPSKPQGVLFQPTAGAQEGGLILTLIFFSVFLLFLPRRYPHFKRFICWTTTAMLVVAALFFTADILRSRMVWHQNLPEHTPFWDGVHSIGEFLVVATLTWLLVLPGLVALAWLWVLVQRRAEAEKRGPRQADPTDS